MASVIDVVYTRDRVVPLVDGLALHPRATG
jgi:hypothetical protein